MIVVAGAVVLVAASLLWVAWRETSALAGDWIIDGGEVVQGRLTVRVDAGSWRFPQNQEPWWPVIRWMPDATGTYDLSATGAARLVPDTPRTERYRRGRSGSFGDTTAFEPTWGQAEIPSTSEQRLWIAWTMPGGTGDIGWWSMGRPGASAPIQIRRAP
jgi:hypothetical protein